MELGELLKWKKKLKTGVIDIHLIFQFPDFVNFDMFTLNILRNSYEKLGVNVF